MTIDEDIEEIQQLVLDIGKLYNEIMTAREEDLKAYRAAAAQFDKLEEERSYRTRKKRDKKRKRGKLANSRKSSTPVASTPKEVKAMIADASLKVAENEEKPPVKGEEEDSKDKDKEKEEPGI
uniref:Uncharacterized protein n=1 Tax=Caenorhabditis japonica TaxID=281687 RepID=A0A8R1DRM0_CAEJA